MKPTKMHPNILLEVYSEKFPSETKSTHWYLVFDTSSPLEMLRTDSKSKLRIFMDLNGYTIGRTYGVVRSEDKRLGGVIFRLHRK